MNSTLASVFRQLTECEALMKLLSYRLNFLILFLFHKNSQKGIAHKQKAEYNDTELLGVSTAAVSKWEKGSTYPDIKLLPALACLLRVDLNTLLSYNDDLTDIEIENFVNDVDKTVQEHSFEAALQKAIAKIHEYPRCEKLIYSAILYLESALFLYSIPEPERYQEQFEDFYKRLSESENPEIRDTSVGMLISYARNRDEFSKAEELINALPFSMIDKEEQLAVLYQRQKKVEDAEKI